MIAQSLISPIIKPIVKSLGSISEEIQKFVTRLVSSRPSYILLDTPIVLGGSFNIKLTFKSSLGVAIMSHTEDTDSLTIDTEGTSIRVFARNGTTLETIIGTPKDPYLDNAWHTLEVDFNNVTNTVTLLVDGEVKATSTWVLDGNQRIRTFGARLQRPTAYDGYIKDIVVSVNSTVVLDLPVDEQYTTTNNVVYSRVGVDATLVNVQNSDSEAA